MGLQEFLKEKKWKKMKKDQWLIVFLAGILLLVIAVPTNCGGETDLAEEKREETVIRTEDYETELEHRLANALSRVEGVGAVEVMITLKDNGESIVEKDVSTRMDIQNEIDETGRETEQTNSERSEETVYRSGDEEGEPFVSKQTNPEIEGVLVIAEGGNNTKVAENISEAVQALFAVEPHKIKVVKMNLQEGSN